MSCPARLPAPSCLRIFLSVLSCAMSSPCLPRPAVCNDLDSRCLFAHKVCFLPSFASATINQMYPLAYAPALNAGGRVLPGLFIRAEHRISNRATPKNQFSGVPRQEIFDIIRRARRLGLVWSMVTYRSDKSR